MAGDTRDRILDAALKAFALNGVAGTNIVDLESAAGLAPGSGGFYRYFKTKDEALGAAVRREVERVLAGRADQPALADADDPRAVLADRLRAALAGLDDLHLLMSILAREHGRIPDLAGEVGEALLEGGLRRQDRQLAAVLQHDAGAHDAGAPDARAVGAVITSALVGYHLATGYFGTAPGGVGPERFVATLVDLVLPQRSDHADDGATGAAAR